MTFEEKTTTTIKKIIKTTTQKVQRNKSVRQGEIIMNDIIKVALRCNGFPFNIQSSGEDNI